MNHKLIMGTGLAIVLSGCVLFDSTPDGLVFHCTFDDQTSISNPAVGPAGKFVQGKFVAGKKGNALRLEPYTPSAAFAFPPNFFTQAGCIEMWFKIMNSKAQVGSGGDPRLFTINQKSSPDNTFFMVDFVNNDGGGDSGVSTWTILGNTASIKGLRWNLTYPQLFPTSDYKDWHHIAVVWDDKGIQGLGEPRTVATFIDGKIIPCAKLGKRSPKGIEQLIADASLLSFTYDPDRKTERNTKSPFLIDEFKIWNYAKTEFNLQ